MTHTIANIKELVQINLKIMKNKMSERDKSC